MNQHIQQLETPRPIRAKLERLRAAIRRYVWLYGVAAVFCAIGAAFWVSLVLDWFFEPPVWARVLMQLAVVGTVVGLFYKTVIDRLRRPLTDSNMALLLERRFPELQDHLLTIIEPRLDWGPDESVEEEKLGLSNLFYQQAADQAAAAVEPIDVRKVFDYTVLRRSAIGAGVLCLTIAIFAVLLPGSAQIWAARMLGLSNELWPRYTRLELLGVEGNMMKVARGDDLSVTIGADLTMPRVPQTVRIDRRTQSGGRESKTMTREGEAIAGQDQHQHFTHIFHSVRESFSFTVEGGDADLGPIQVDVVDSPTVDSMKLRCHFPAYMGRKSRDIKVIGPMSIPRGTKVTILGRSVKSLTRVQAELIGGEKKKEDEDDAEKEAYPVTLDRDDPHRFRCELAPLTDSASYRFTLNDTDGIQGREPFILTISAANDEPPELPSGLYGIGSVVTSRAYLPVRGKAVDDYGIARIWFDYTIDPEQKGEEVLQQSKEGQKQPSAGPQGPERHGRQVFFETEGNPTELALDAALDLEPLGLKPGQKIAVTVSAIDRCTLDGNAKAVAGPDVGSKLNVGNVGSGRRRILEVVLPERLMILLQARELVMRQRFEAILDEVNDTREILVRLDFTKKDKDEGQKLQDELGVRRAIENCRKNAEETRAVAEVFENIRLQMIHNRINSAETTERLATGIVAPLKSVVEQGFPELEREIERLLIKLADPDLGPKQRDMAVSELDSLLEVMNGALARMLEMEDYNELIKILRQVIDAQQDLDQKIRERRKASLQDLLED